MSAITTPGVYVEFVPPPAQLNPVGVDVVALLGVFERGPVDTPVRVASWPQIQAVFGDFIANGIGAYALKAWSDNGGRVAWVVRVAAAPRTAQAAGAQPADRATSALDDLSGLVPGAAAAVVQGDGTWLYLVTAADPIGGTVTWDRPLDPAIDTTLPFAVHTGCWAATATLSDALGTPVLTLTASTPGAWSNDLRVLAEPRFAAATVSRPIPAPPMGATSVESCDGFAAGMLVRLTQLSGAVVVTEQRIVTAVDPAALVLIWDAPLSVVNPTAALRIEALSFALSVSDGGILQEVHDELSVVPGSPRFVVDVLAAESALLTGAVPTATPPPPASSIPAPAGWVALAGGLDGTAALAPADILGDEAAGLPRGLASLVACEEPAIVCVPDLVAQPVAPRIRVPAPPESDPCVPCPPPPPPPALAVARIVEASAALSDDDVASVQAAIVADCEARGDRIALLDPPCASGPLAVPALISWRRRFDSTYAAMYAPWVLVLDPLATTPGQPPLPWGTLRRLPPSGHLAGLLALVDADAGPWQAPANRPLQWVHQTDLALDDPAHGRLNAAGVDVVRSLRGHGVAVLGARTVSNDPSWLFLNVRRLFLMLERTLRVGLAWTAFEPAGAALEATMTSAITGLLEDLFDRGAFGGADPQSSFFVQTGGGDPVLGEVIVLIGIVPAPPAEVIVLQVMRTEDQLAIREQPVQGSAS